MDKGNSGMLIHRYSFAEEMFNSISHAVGTLFSIVALVILVAFASVNHDVWGIVSFSIYGVTMFFLYLSSTLYHSVFHEKTKKIFRMFDHISIYLLIAGSYTPITLIALRGAWGWTLFGLIWILAIIGIILNIMNFEKMKYLSIVLYILMGWLLIIAVKPMLLMIPKGFFMWLLLGGLTYTIGVIFYVCKKIPFNHGIWHLFVLAGTIFHFFGMLFYLA